MLHCPPKDHFPCLQYKARLSVLFWNNQHEVSSAAGLTVVKSTKILHVKKVLIHQCCMNHRFIYSVWKMIKREPLYPNPKFASFLLFHGKCISSTCSAVVMPYLKTPVPKARGCGSTVHTACGWKTWAPASTSGLHTAGCCVFPSEQLLVPSSLQPLLPWGKQWMPEAAQMTWMRLAPERMEFCCFSLENSALVCILR